MRYSRHVHSSVVVSVYASHHVVLLTYFIVKLHFFFNCMSFHLQWNLLWTYHCVHNCIQERLLYFQWPLTSNNVAL